MTVLATPTLTDIDPSKLIIELTTTPTTSPDFSAPFGTAFSDHMLTIHHVPGKGWGAPKISPYANLSISPAAAAIQYAASLFEGMKAYRAEGGQPRIFRPSKNMARMNSSAERIGLPQFDHEALISLIKTLVTIDAAFIPPAPGTLYLRPTMMGTRPTLGMGVDDNCTLFVILSPVASYFNFGKDGLSILATKDSVRAWPGGTGCYKLSSNYGPTFLPQKKAKQLGYDQNLWCFGNQITENGGSNFFAVVESKEGVTQLYTAPLDGQILPGVTRDSLLILARGHISGELVVEGLPTSKFEVKETEFTLQDLKRWSDEGRLKETFGAGTAVLISPIGRIGIPTDSGEIEDILIPNSPETGFGPIATALLAQISGIQWGTKPGPKGWSVVCE